MCMHGWPRIEVAMHLNELEHCQYSVLLNISMQVMLRLLKGAFTWVHYHLIVFTLSKSVITLTKYTK